MKKIVSALFAAFLVFGFISNANAAKNAGIPVILMEDGYTEKKTNEIYHNHLVKDFIGIEKIVSKYL